MTIELVAAKGANGGTTDMTRIDVAIVGLGPWGLSVFERLVTIARAANISDLSVHAHVIDPGAFGVGAFTADLPDYLILNTPSGWHAVSSIDDLPVGREVTGGVRQTFLDWIRAQGYGWADGDRRVERGGRPIGPDDFVPRRLMGEYLTSSYASLVSDAPPRLRTVEHHASVVDIIALANGRERVVLSDDSTLEVDHVVLATGHTPSTWAARPGAGEVLAPYPVDTFARLDVIPALASVAIRGMGLVGLDVLLTLTVGRGGRFVEHDGDLRYEASGLEPSISMFSRSGYPYCAKSSQGTLAPSAEEYEPAICTPAAIVALRAGGSTGPDGRLDARAHLLPLIFAEMQLRFYSHSARYLHGQARAQEVRDNLIAAWTRGCFSEAICRIAEEYGVFEPANHVFVGSGVEHRSAKIYEEAVYAVVRGDLNEASLPIVQGAVKAAYAVPRVLRDVIRGAVEFGGLTVESHLDFQQNIRTRFARLIAGPPIVRSRQLLALIDAGILRLPFGPDPEVEPTADDRFCIRSRNLEEPHSQIVDFLIHGVLEEPSLRDTASPLLINLREAGRLRELHIDGRAVGAVDLSADFHPRNAAGEVERTLSVFGPLTEGVRYYTGYLPSPKDRRAATDAGACIEQILSRVPTSQWAPSQHPPSPRRPMPHIDLLRSIDRIANVPVQRDSRRPAPAANVCVDSPDRLCRCGTWQGAAGDAPAIAAPRLRIGFVNNMPDAAFAETEQQFLGLLEGGSRDQPICVRRYALASVARDEATRRDIARGYYQLGDLYADPPHALIVSGAEPRRTELTDETYWPELRDLLAWAAESVCSALLSCLASHASLLVHDGIARTPLDAKLSGVFALSLADGDDLVAELPSVAFPHSRINTVQPSVLRAHGYRVLLESPASGWTLAAGERGHCLFVLLQGHPEYSASTLLREYRRDARRYLEGLRPGYPSIPSGYLDATGSRLLEDFAAAAHSAAASPSLMDDFPFAEAERHICVDWQGASSVLIDNWLATVERRMLAPISR